MARDHDRTSKAELLAKAGAVSVPAVVGGIAGGPLGAVVTAAGGEIVVDGVKQPFGRLDAARRARASVPVSLAALSADAAPEELFERIERDPKLAALAYSATAAAAGSAMTAKVIALGQFLTEAVDYTSGRDQPESELHRPGRPD